MRTGDSFRAIRKNIGRRVAALRRRARISQSSLARAINLDRSYLSKLEHGKRNPSIDVYIAIARIFGLQLSELFADVDNPDADSPSGIESHYWL